MNNSNIDDSTAPPSGSGRHFVVKAAPRVTASGNPISSDDDDQPILMEAKLREIIMSVNQLVNSNKALDEALMDEHDDDLLDALKENEDLIHRKIFEATSLAAKLNKHGVHISLADKITQYDGSLVLKMEKERKTEKNGGDGIYL
ncbi:hypothetical protein ACHAWT_010813 [Skeletonema menzelii]|mmetsp:Transcript_18658/g.30556  ORF Transcript_18658/g.30556 Transcript_18658/m.30556 type:complete len:145 (-) Transcript_18658:605-1039(-)